VVELEAEVLTSPEDLEASRTREKELQNRGVVAEGGEETDDG